MRHYHHHYDSVQHDNHYEGEYIEDEAELDKIISELESRKHPHRSGRYTRQSIEDYLEQKRTRNQNRDPFEDDYMED